MKHFQQTLKKLTIPLIFGLTLTMAACSDSGGGDSAGGSNASQATTGADHSTAESAATDQGQWPRSVDSLVVADGKATEKTEKVEIAAKPERIVSTFVTLTGSLLAINAPVVATGGGQPGPVATDDGFFTQWADVAKERNVESLYILEPNLEKIVAQKPDLIIVSAAGADSATGVYDQLKDVAPVIVADYSNQSWEDLMTQLGQVTGHESDAEQALADFSSRTTKVKDAITLPAQPTNFVLTLPAGKGLNFWTTDSAQGRLLKELGFELLQPSDDLVDTSGQWAKRKDVKHVVAENVDKALGGKTVLVMNTDGTEDPVAQLKADTQLADTEAVSTDALYAMEPDLFRMDYYSASSLLEQIEKHFVK